MSGKEESNKDPLKDIHSFMDIVNRYTPKFSRNKNKRVYSSASKSYKKLRRKKNQIARCHRMINAKKKA